MRWYALKKHVSGVFELVATFEGGPADVVARIEAAKTAEPDSAFIVEGLHQPPTPMITNENFVPAPRKSRKGAK